MHCSPDEAAQPAGQIVHMGCCAGERGQPACQDGAQLSMHSVSRGCGACQRACTYKHCINKPTTKKSSCEARICAGRCCGCPLTLPPALRGHCHHAAVPAAVAASWRQTLLALHQQELQGIAICGDAILGHHHYLKGAESGARLSSARTHGRVETRGQARTHGAPSCVSRAQQRPPALLLRCSAVSRPHSLQALPCRLPCQPLINTP